MKTFKQFIEAPKKPKGPSKTPATDSMKIKHDSQRDAHADRSRLDKEKQSTDFLEVFEDEPPIDTILGVEIFPVVHMKTKEEIYVSLEDIK